MGFYVKDLNKCLYSFDEFKSVIDSYADMVERDQQIREGYKGWTSNSIGMCNTVQMLGTLNEELHKAACPDEYMNKYLDYAKSKGVSDAMWTYYNPSNV